VSSEGERYPSIYYAVDGHRCRSLSEVVIDNCLYRNGIRHRPEDFIDARGANYKYDWYLPDADLYLEFYGSTNREYRANAARKEEFYRKCGKAMVAIEPPALARVDTALRELLAKYWAQITCRARYCPRCGGDLG
jgi:hypothetical protein